MNRAALVTTLAVLIVGTALGVWFGGRSPAVPGTVAIDRAATGAFGLLSPSTVSRRTTTSESAAPATADSGTGTAVVPQPLKPFVGYRYVYRGDTIALAAASVDVLERTPASADLPLGDYGLGLFTASTFRNARVQTVTLAQPDGYALFVDTVNGSASITEAIPNGAVRAPALTNAAGATLPDARIIAIANAFLAEHGIDRGPYGAPTVTSYSGGIATTAPGTAVDLVRPSDIAMSVPSTVQYPLRIEEQDAVGYGGEPYGLAVSVDPVRERVTAVFNLTTQRYRASAYTAVTEFATVRAVAERGGIYGGSAAAGEGVTELALGTPSRVWMTLSRYDGAQSHELLVPALRFPVQNPPAGWMAAVVVPLAKDLLTPEEIKPVPLPAEGGAGVAPDANASTTTGSAGAAAGY